MSILWRRNKNIMGQVLVNEEAGIKALSEALGWVDVKGYGAKGDGTTDDTAAIQAAIDAASGAVLFPSGIYAISDSLVLRSATTYLGPQGGTFITGEEHPSVGYGAALKWIGAASGTMVNGTDVLHVYWDGIDLDGVDVADTVKGFTWLNDAALTRHVHMTNFRIFNCGTGIQIGAAGGDSNLDGFTIKHFRMYMCNTGIHCMSQNTGYSSFENGMIDIYKKGIYLEGAGFVNIRDIAFAGLQNMVAGDGFIVASVHGAITIQQTQGETGAFTGWNHLVAVGSGTYKPITLISNTIDRAISIESNRKIISIGNNYNAGVTLTAATTGAWWESNSDYYASGIGITDSGANNIITEINPYYTGGITATSLMRTKFNNVVVSNFKYSIPTYADNAAAKVGGLVDGDIYRTSTGIVMVVYT